MTTPILESITAEEVAELLRDAGFRATVSRNGALTQVQSAAQGLSFFIVFGSPAAGAADRYLDFSLHCWINVQGDLPPSTVTRWNQTKRFSRLFTQGQSLVLTADVMVAGGVTLTHLRSQCELWDRVIRDLVLHLKDPATKEITATEGVTQEKGAVA